MSLRQNAPCIPKTASFTLDMLAVKSGSRITNRGAVGAVTMTLPTPQTGNMSFDGYQVEFQGVADQTFTVAAAAGKAVCFNNAAATSLACSTGGQKIGALIKATWDAAGGKWLLTGEAVGVTYTVA
jgi:hypothetical protein